MELSATKGAKNKDELLIEPKIVTLGEDSELDEDTSGLSVMSGISRLPLSDEEGDENCRAHSEKLAPARARMECPELRKR